MTECILRRKSASLILKKITSHQFQIKVFEIQQSSLFHHQSAFYQNQNGPMVLNGEDENAQLLGSSSEGKQTVEGEQKRDYFFRRDL